VAFVLQMTWVEKKEGTGRYDEPVVVQSYPLMEAFDLDANKVLHGEVWRLLTYAFLHSPGITHILFNMLFLWWFGSDVEDLYGPKEFLAIYLTSAVVGGVGFTLTEVAGLGDNVPCIGASGAVTAVLVICALHYPTRMILLFMLLPVPIWAFVVFQVGRDFLAFITHSSNGIAVTVHLGGAAFGYFYHQRQWRLLSLFAGFRGWQRQRSRPRLRVYHEDAPQPVSVAAPPSAPDVDEHLEAKMDAVLEKVKRSGMNSLTEGERQILVRASEVFKRRRT